MSFRHVVISTLTVACILGGISAHGADYNYVKIAKLAAHAGRYDQDQIAISGYVFESTLERYWRDGDAFVTWNLVLSDDVTLDRGSATALCYESGYNGDIIEKAAQISRMEKHLGHQVTVVGIFNSSREILNMRRLIYSDAEGELHDIDTDLGDYVLSDYQRHYDWDTYNWDTYDYDIHYTVWYGHCHIWPRPYWWGWYEPVYIVRIPVVDRRTVVYHYTPHVRPPRGRVYAHTPVLYDDRVPTRAIRLNPRTLPQPRGSGHPTFPRSPETPGTERVHRRGTPPPSGHSGVGGTGVAPHRERVAPPSRVSSPTPDDGPRTRVSPPSPTYSPPSRPSAPREPAVPRKPATPSSPERVRPTASAPRPSRSDAIGRSSPRSGPPPASNSRVRSAPPPTASRSTPSVPRRSRSASVGRSSRTSSPVRSSSGSVRSAPSPSRSMSTARVAPPSSSGGGGRSSASGGRRR